MPGDFGANLVQHFIGRYSRYSRYQTVLSKLQEIITALRQLFRYTKSSASAGLFVLNRYFLIVGVDVLGDPKEHQKQAGRPGGRPLQKKHIHRRGGVSPPAKQKALQSQSFLYIEIIAVRL